VTGGLRTLVVLALGITAGARRAAAAPPFHAVPPVQVIELPDKTSDAIVLHNDGAAAVVVGSITAEPGCDDAVQASPLDGFMLDAGATQSIAITCKPAPAGMKRCGYRVRSATDAVLLELEAVCAYAGAPTLSPSATAIDFGSVAVGGSAPVSIELHNTGTATIHHLFIETTDLAGNFAVSAPCNPDVRACDAAISAVPADGKTNLVVRCTPRAPGVQTAQLYVTTDTGTRLTQPIALTCTGAATMAPVISVWPSAIDVGAVEVLDATAHATVHVTNAGTGTLHLLDVQIVDSGGAAAADWSYIGHAPCSAGIPPACDLIVPLDTTPPPIVDLDVGFDPSAIGVRDATLLIHYNDTADRSISIPLHGIGQGATLDLLGGPAVLDFGTLPLNTTAALTVLVTNRGSRALTDGGVTLTLATGSPFTVTPSPPFSVATGGVPTMITVECRPTTAAVTSATLAITAPDTQSPPINLALRCAGDSATTLTATPPALLLGEVRTGTRPGVPILIAGVSGSTPISSVALATPNSILTVSAATIPPAMLTVTAAPLVDGDLANRLIVTPGSGPPLAVAISGVAVTAGSSVPPAVSLGTFCVEQPTTSRILELSSTGTATLALTAPTLASDDSPFDLALVAPVVYPTTLAPLQRAVITATPRRSAAVGVVTDEVIWPTDIAGAASDRTTLTATFLKSGTAIAPGMLNFSKTPIHLDTVNAQEVTLRNCDASPIQLDPPAIPAPFSIDSPSIPSVLQPGELTTFSVGFHPTKAGPAKGTLVITSPQLIDVQLTVMLMGEGFANGGGSSDAGSATSGVEQTSFYACGGCAANDAPGALVLATAVLYVLVPPRRRAVARGARRS